jgi:hypothetical protein
LLDLIGCWPKKDVDRRLQVDQNGRPVRHGLQTMQKKDHSEKSLRARQRGIRRMSDHPKVLPTFEDSHIIVAKRSGYSAMD